MSAPALRTAFMLLLSLIPLTASAQPFQPAWRPAAGLAGGLVGAVGGATLVGWLSYYGARLAGAKDTCGHRCYVPPTVNWGVGGAVVGGVAGVGLGTWAAGRISGGDGAMWATYAGEGVGLGVATVLLLTDAVSNYEPVAFLALSVAGAVVGYELSAHGGAGDPTAGSQRQSRAPAIIVPVWSGFLWF